MRPPIQASTSTGLTITNPLVLYRALLATNRIHPDPAQHRLALDLQKLYYRLKDYSPHEEYGARIKAISNAVQRPIIQTNDREAAVEGHGLRRNPLFARLFAAKQDRDTLALTKVLTSNEAAITLDSPKGMLLHGEVGCGKSMLLDLLADSLPNRKKRRWHFNTFMLDILAQLENLRKERANSTAGVAYEHSLLYLAKDLIDKSPILFLDEFQLPDRAASKILSNLFTTFFQLGGVLIASSNRMPDELAKASGMDYTTANNGVVTFGRPKLSKSPANNEYAGFVDVLKARCEIHDLCGRDWRRKEAEEADDAPGESARLVEPLKEADSIQNFPILHPARGEESLNEPVSHTLQDLKSEKLLLPRFYMLDTSPDEAWDDAIQVALPSDFGFPIPWQTTTLVVFGRKVTVRRQLKGVSHWSFKELCGGTLGPADYITLASTFHTLILDEVPILTLLQKNEARRMITLLDALYEARCKLVMRAEAGPDDLFFPETTVVSNPSSDQSKSIKKDNNYNGDAVYPETLSEIFQDQTSPFRPNISTYTDGSRADYGSDDESDAFPVPGGGNEIGRQVDFGMTSSFTGEDERFAYKRARSRLWQLCSASWNARCEPGWWTPLPVELRRWERSSSDLPASHAASEIDRDVRMGASVELDKHAGLEGHELQEPERAMEISSREKREAPPVFGWTHAWGMMKWGKRAGLGVKALRDCHSERASNS